MKEKIIICLDNLNDLEKFKSQGITMFLFPLKGFSIGHNGFELSEIKEDNAYLLINRLLDSKDIDNLEEILKSLPANIKGVYFEDMGVYQLVQDLNLDIELIWYQNHFGTNSKIINFWLERVESTVISNEITKEEIETICNNAKKPVVLFVFGYNQVMYSRRKLLTNYQDNFNLERKNKLTLREDKSNLEFIALEDDNGTVFLNRKVYNGLELLQLNNVKHYLIDASFIDSDKLIELISSDFNIKNVEIATDNGFLARETIYKLEGRD